VDVQFSPFLVRSFSTLVLSTDLDIHFGPFAIQAVRGDVHSMTHDLMSLNKLKDDARFVTPVKIAMPPNMYLYIVLCILSFWQCSLCFVMVRSGVGPGRGRAPSSDYRKKYSVINYRNKCVPPNTPIIFLI